MAIADLKIVDIKAYPTSFPVPKESQVTLGIGRSIKRDAVVVKVVTAGGLVGWGEAHHGRAHTAAAKLLETTDRKSTRLNSSHGYIRMPSSA